MEYITPKNILIAYIVLINIATFLAYGLDKWKAEKGSWRIRESTLILIALFGGAAGALLGMFMFRHKTQKKKFTIVVPVLLIIQIAMIVLLLFYKIRGTL